LPPCLSSSSKISLKERIPISWHARVYAGGPLRPQRTSTSFAEVHVLPNRV
jgi:hypothetical protein